MEMPTMSTVPPSSSGWWSQLPFSNFLRFWDYRPSTQWLDHFITVNWNAGDAGVEQHVLGEVGSYGYQLSRILDAVNLLVDRLSLSELSPEQQKVVVRLQDLADQANRAVHAYRSGATEPSA
jgi:hypothetical protein